MSTPHKRQFQTFLGDMNAKSQSKYCIVLNETSLEKKITDFGFAQQGKLKISKSRNVNTLG